MRAGGRNPCGRLHGREVELASDLDAVFYGAGDRTTIGIDLEYPFYGLPVFLIRREMKGLLDPLDHQHLALGLYLPDRVGVEAIYIERNLTRCQRARKGAEQSPAGRRDQVIEGGRVWLLRIRGDAVVFGDLAMDPEEHRLFQRWEMGAPDLPLHRLYLDP